MDIHGPMKRVESLKEFFTHILIVTIGILIALGLEGIRESWREHAIASEARESIRAELTRNLKKFNEDQEQLRHANEQLAQIEENLPQLAKSPAQLKQRLGSTWFRFYGYAFETSAWEEAVSSGAVAHMDKEDVHRFATYYVDMKNYQDITRNTFPVFADFRGFFLSHDSFSQSELSVGEEKAIRLYTWSKTLEGIGPDVRMHMEQALGVQNRN